MYRKLGTTSLEQAVDTLLKTGPKKINVIKVIHRLNMRVSLTDAKIMSKSVPIQLLHTNSMTKAFNLYRELCAIGAHVTIR